MCCGPSLKFIVFPSPLNGTNEPQYWHNVPHCISQWFEVPSGYTLPSKTRQPKPTSYKFLQWKLTVFLNCFHILQMLEESKFASHTADVSRRLEQYCRKFRLSIYHLAYRICLEPHDETKACSMEVAQLKPIASSIFPKKCVCIQALRLHQFVSVSSETSLKAGFNFHMYFTTDILSIYGKGFLSTQLQAHSHQKDFSSHSPVTLHTRHSGFPFSSAKTHCIRKLIKSCYYKLKASYLCSYICSLGRWQVRKYGSLKSISHQLFGTETGHIINRATVILDWE